MTTPNIGGVNIAPTRETYVHTACSRMESVVIKISDQVAQLTQRLAPVLRSEPPTETGAAEVSINLCPLANILNVLREKLEDTTTELQSIFDRLEV